MGSRGGAPEATQGAWWTARSRARRGGGISAKMHRQAERKQLGGGGAEPMANADADGGAEPMRRQSRAPGGRREAGRGAAESAPRGCTDKPHGCCRWGA